MRFIGVATCLRPTAVPSRPRNVGAREWALQTLFVDPPHEAQIFGRDRTGLVIDRAPADVQSLRLAGNRKIARSVHHRFALSKPALVSAPSKKLSAPRRAACGIETGSR